MTKRTPIRFTTALVTLLSLALVTLAFLNFQQRRRYQQPEDGVSWVDSPEGVVAWIVAKDGPGDRAGIREHDRLLTINGKPVEHAIDAIREVFHSGVWTRALYGLERNGSKYQTEVVIRPQADSNSIRLFLGMVGLLYLLIGAFVLLRRRSAFKSIHFYLFCLCSFVLFTYSYTGKLNLFDWTIYWLSVVSLIVQPALFLHFCLSFPERPPVLRGRSYMFALVYVPGALLLAIHVLVAMGVLILPIPLLTARWLLDRLELIYLAGYWVAGALALQHSYRLASVPVIKQQLKWVTRGTLLAILPFATLYALPYFLGFIPATWMKLSVLSLVFLPLTFGYAIVRYRLMDVDIIFRRGIAYTLATAAIVGVYFGLIALFADFFRNTVPSRAVWVVAIIVTAILFQPIVNWIQIRLEKFFNRERYDYRKTLRDFRREITSELHVDRLLDKMVDRLADTLGVDRLAVFLMTEAAGFRLEKARGITLSAPLDLSFLDPNRSELQKGYLFFDSVRHVYGVTPSAQSSIERLDLHYYLPFQIQGRTLGYLGLGKTRQGDYLSSEDVDLLQSIVGYVSVALENARLYESLEQKALEYQTLRDFNENIVESVNVGVLACNQERRVEFWNAAMENLYGLKRSEALGRTLDSIFPPELLAELPQASEPRRELNLYKFRLQAAEGRELIVNLSTVPLLGKDNKVLGRLVIINDLTERVNLEHQLIQAEKLSSIGLLSAGIAHEVNTPLAVITSQAQMLLRQMPPADPSARVLDKIIKQAFRASEIVNNLLKFSRVSGSEFSELDLNKVIRETLSLADPMLRAAKISVNAQLAPPAVVVGNPGKLQQVFMNLIMNARDAMPRGGELTIATESIDSHVLVEVADNGVGIPADHLAKIFDPFFTTKASSRGTGLGLAVTYGIIREHSGKIFVESAVGKGTSFRLEFPSARKAVNVT
jgi:PAS domain S-box-containing protein